jgi:hypothetical protein
MRLGFQPIEPFQSCVGQETFTNDPVTLELSRIILFVFGYHIFQRIVTGGFNSFE